jgi:hypothetical protein
MLDSNERYGLPVYARDCPKVAEVQMGGKFFVCKLAAFPE